MEKGLSKILEERAAEELIIDLFVAVDQKNWSRVTEIFAEQVYFDMTSMSGGEASTIPSKEIVSGWKTALKDVDAVHHQVGNLKVDLSGDTADVFCYGVAYHYEKEEQQYMVKKFVGSYQLQLAAHEDKWKISRFVFHLKFITEDRYSSQIQ